MAQRGETCRAEQAEQRSTCPSLVVGWDGSLARQKAMATEELEEFRETVGQGTKSQQGVSKNTHRKSYVHASGEGSTANREKNNSF